MRCFAIILAAGKGERMGFDKVRYALRGKPIWRYSYDTFRSHPRIEGVGVVGDVESDDATFIRLGGATRSDSSRIGLEAVPDWADIVLIHDAARPFVTHDIIDRVIECVETRGPATPGVPSPDTIKQVRDEWVTTLIRNELFATQTPQGALREQLLSLYRDNKQEFTDDMAVLENSGIKTFIVPGDPNNFKVTTPEDLVRAGAVLGTPEIRTGLGFDIHRFSTEPNRPLWLGGVLFEGEVGLEGHSDADVVLHAVVDALLGAASLGDIGCLYPNTDPQWKNFASLRFVQDTKALLDRNGWQIINVDIAVIAEKPKIMKRALEIRQAIARALECDLSRISIKATTNEQLGSLGRGEGISAYATATIRERF